jgi:hypothetical protein
MHYVLNRRNGLLIRYADNRPIYDRCKHSNTLSRPHPTFWNQPTLLQDMGV